MRLFFTTVLTVITLLPTIAAAAAGEEITEERFEQLVASGKVKKCTISIADEESDCRTIKGTCDSGDGPKQFAVDVAYTEALEKLLRENVPDRRFTKESRGAYILSFIPLLALVAFAFWGWMLADCLKKTHPQSNDKLIWVLVIILTNLIGAFLYFFIQRAKTKITERGQ